MKIIDRYIVKEIALNFSAALFVLALIIIGNTFVRLLGDISEGSIPVDVLGKLVFLGSINAIVQLTPIALLIGMMLAFGRLYKDQEMSSLLSAGIGPRFLFKSIMLFVIPLTILLMIVILAVLPNLEKTMQNIKNEIKQRPEASGIPIGKFMHSSFKGSKLTLFVESLNKEDLIMNHFFMHINENGEKQTENILTAKNALLYIDPESGERVLKINNGSRYEELLNNNTRMLFKFSEHGIRIPAIISKTNNRIRTVSTTKLLTDQSPKAVAEVHWRIALILSAPIMALLAFPLSYTTPRQGHFSKIALGIVLYAIYANLIIFGKSLLEDQKIPNGVGIWWVHILFLILAIWLIRRQFSKA